MLSAPFENRILSLAAGDLKATQRNRKSVFLPFLRHMRLYGNVLQICALPHLTEKNAPQRGKEGGMRGL